MTQVWIWSDPHFGHKNIQKYEPSRLELGTLDEMDEAIIKNYNDTIKEGDIVIWLGDMFFCKAKRMEYIASKLQKGRNILVRGNHDKGVSDTKFKRLGFNPHRMYQYGDAILTHEPVSQVNMGYLKDNGIWKNMHGHTHSDTTNLNPNHWQCFSVEMTDFKPVKIEDAFARFWQ